MKKLQSGLTLVEMMIVVLLIGLLALMASPLTGSWVHGARVGEALGAMEQAVGQAAGQRTEGQTHPIGVYLKVWGLLFVLSTLSYLVDYFHVQGYLRWFLIIVFMMLKAGLIVSVFMHLQWERLVLRYVVLLPPLLLLVLVALMVFESDYVLLTRSTGG